MFRSKRKFNEYQEFLMSIAPYSLFSSALTAELDELLFAICEELQLAPSRHTQAEERYKAISRLLELPSSPFSSWRPTIYPQGSMALGTTIHPLKGPHDLDFVLELEVSYRLVNPMNLINDLYRLLREHGTYREMVELKNRCVRVVYANEFYMDILPGCRDHSPESPTAIRVPDRQASGWRPSDPLGYVKWFRERSVVTSLLAKDTLRLPSQQETREKRPLQLVVQLLKRWRDICYQGDSIAPISIVLTTLAANYYNGQSSVSESLSWILDGISNAVSDAQRQRSRIVVLNPANLNEDLSERWAADPAACQAFVNGIFDLRRKWQTIVLNGGNIQKQLGDLFGETVQAANDKRAKLMQEERRAGRIGVSKLGGLTSAGTPGLVPMRPNTFHGPESVF
jgi:hypothetical protein